MQLQKYRFWYRKWFIDMKYSQFVIHVVSWRGTIWYLLNIQPRILHSPFLACINIFMYTKTPFQEKNYSYLTVTHHPPVTDMGDNFEYKRNKPRQIQATNGKSKICFTATKQWLATPILK